MRQRQSSTPPRDFGFGSGPALPMLGAAQRASLGRGLAFVLTLTLACLVLVYGPLIVDRAPRDRSGDRAPSPASPAVPEVDRLPDPPAR